MKKLMLGLLLSLGLGANACVDFTGNYVFGEKTADEVTLELTQTKCESLTVVAVQGGSKSQPSVINTDGKLRKDGTNPYYLSSTTHTKDGLRLVDIFVQDEVIQSIAETTLTKAANGDLLMDIRDTNGLGEVTMMKMVGTKK